MKAWKEKNSKVKEAKVALLNLAIKSNNEINKNKILKELIQYKQNQINKNKEYLLLFSSFNKNSYRNIKNEIEKNINISNKKLLENKELMTKKINNLSEKCKLNSLILESTIEQQKNILEAIRETNFLLENKIKEKESLIKKYKEFLYQSVLIFSDEYIKEIDLENYSNYEEFYRIIDNSLLFDEEFYQQYLLYKLMKFNKIKNKVNKLVEKKRELENFINQNYNKKSKTININNNNTNINYNKNIYNEEIINKIDFNNVVLCNNNNIFITSNMTTEGSIFNINDSLYFDTDEQIDVEFPENDFSTYFLSQKSLILNTKKKIVIPPLNLELIKYNANIKGSLYREISLSRSFEDDLTHRIKKIKKQIKSYKIQNKNLYKKCEKYEKKLKEIALIFYFNPKNNNITNNNYNRK